VTEMFFALDFFPPSAAAAAVPPPPAIPDTARGGDVDNDAATEVLLLFAIGLEWLLLGSRLTGFTDDAVGADDCHVFVLVVSRLLVFEPGGVTAVEAPQPKEADADAVPV